MRRPKRRGISRSATPYRKRPYVPRKSYAGPTRAIAAPSVGLGQSARTVLKTEFFANLAPAAGTGVFTGFLKPGSAFDPAGDIAAMQPATYDQWASVYNRYVVEKAWVKIEFGRTFLETAASNPTFVAAAYPSVSSGALTTYQGAASQPFSKSVMGTTSDTTSTNCMVFKLDHAKVLGRKGAVSAEDNGALTTGDPPAGEFMVLPIFVQNVSNVANNITIRVVMYQTIWFDRRLNVVDA